MRCQITRFVPKLSTVQFFYHLQYTKTGGRPGPFYHINVFQGRQRGGLGSLVTFYTCVPCLKQQAADRNYKKRLPARSFVFCVL